MRNIFSWDIIKRFSGSDQDCFTYQDVVSEYPDADKIYLSKVLSGMVKKGMLIKLNHGLYHIVNGNYLLDRVGDPRYSAYHWILQDL